MGLLGKIFKRKEGGTFLGNIIRGVASTYSGGILGNGAQMKKGPSAQELVDQAMANQQGGQAQAVQPAQPAPNPLADKLNEFLKASTKDVTIQGGLDPNTKWYIGGAVGALLIGILLIKKS